MIIINIIVLICKVREKRGLGQRLTVFFTFIISINTAWICPTESNSTGMGSIYPSSAFPEAFSFHRNTASIPWKNKNTPKNISDAFGGSVPVIFRQIYFRSCFLPLRIIIPL